MITKINVHFIRTMFALNRLNHVFVVVRILKSQQSAILKPCLSSCFNKNVFKTKILLLQIRT